MKRLILKFLLIAATLWLITGAIFLYINRDSDVVPASEHHARLNTRAMDARQLPHAPCETLMDTCANTCHPETLDCVNACACATNRAIETLPLKTVESINRAGATDPTFARILATCR